MLLRQCRICFLEKIEFEKRASRGVIYNVMYFINYGKVAKMRRRSPQCQNTKLTSLYMNNMSELGINRNAETIVHYFTPVQRLGPVIDPTSRVIGPSS